MMVKAESERGPGNVLARVRELYTNVTSKAGEPPLRALRRDTRVTDSPELSFLVRGELFRHVKGVVPESADVIKSILLGRKRSFAQDTEHVSGGIEQAVILGTEHIPTTDKPIIVAINHPDLYDLVGGLIHTTNTFSQTRRQHDVPGDIRWMVAKKIPPRDEMQRRAYRALNGSIGLGLKMLTHTYDFIPVETHGSGLEAFLMAKRHLTDETGSRILGMAPEGDITRGDSLGAFHKGIGALVERTGAVVVPVGISRDEEKNLTIEFGETVQRADPTERAASITNRVRAAVSLVS